jgi:hypothetical protein
VDVRFLVKKYCNEKSNLEKKLWQYNGESCSQRRVSVNNVVKFSEINMKVQEMDPKNHESYYDFSVYFFPKMSPTKLRGIGNLSSATLFDCTCIGEFVSLHRLSGVPRY